jgi:flagellar L-ring protein precursor FlgH
MCSKKSVALTLFFLISLLSFSFFVQADSLWNDQAESLYTSPKAQKPGDVLTVIVEEQTSALQSGTTQSDRDSGIQLNLDNSSESKYLNRNTQSEDKLDLGFTGANTFRGVGRTMRNSTVKTTITATVIDVQPNGNLFIMGQRELDVNSETQKIEISGIVRRSDISAQNTIYSSQLANAKIAIRGSGPVSTPQNTGLFNKLFGWLI